MSPATNWLPDVDLRRRNRKPPVTAGQLQIAAAVIAGRLRCDPKTARRAADRMPATELGDSPAWQAMHLSLADLRALADPLEPR